MRVEACYHVLVADVQLVVLPSAIAQANTPVTFTDAGSGITFNSWPIANGGSQTQGGYTFGVALPSNALTTDATEFIGYLVCCVYTFTRGSQMLTSPSNARPRTRRVGAVSPLAAP